MSTEGNSGQAPSPIQVGCKLLKLIGKMENKGYEMWKEWMIQDSILFDELIKENKTEYGDKENLS